MREGWKGQRGRGACHHVDRAHDARGTEVRGLRGGVLMNMYAID